MPLTTCIECGHPVSDSAYLGCPHCSASEPYGVACELCGKRLRRSTGVTSSRRERKMHRGSDDNWWHVDFGTVDRDIVAHKECLEHFYSPPSTFFSIDCSDCGLKLTSTEPGLTALDLWSDTIEPRFYCHSCGNSNYLWAARCRWAPEPGETCFQALGPLCMRPLYSFQVKPNAYGHGHHSEQQESMERREATTKQEEQKALHDNQSRCFVATACYGSATTQEVMLLRRFRDRTLAHTRIGRGLIFRYYQLSPMLAAHIARSPRLRHFVRQLCFAPVIKLLRRYYRAT